jgi:hypothetical protein
VFFLKPSLFLAKIFYTTSDLKHGYKYHEIFSFKACRNFSRAVSKAYRNDWKKYIQVDWHMKFNGIRRVIKEDQRRIESEALLATYNEFEF